VFYWEAFQKRGRERSVPRKDLKVEGKPRSKKHLIAKRFKRATNKKKSNPMKRTKSLKGKRKPSGEVGKGVIKR